MSDASPPWSLLVSDVLLRMLSDRGVDLEHFISRSEAVAPVQRFPDGSLCIEWQKPYELFFQVYEQIPERLRFLGGGFRSLASFAPRLYLLDYPREYNEAVGTVGFFAGIPQARHPMPEEYRLEHLALTVQFRRRPNAHVVEAYGTMVDDWLDHTREHGVFGEGPVLAACEEVEFRGLRARFHVDARRSGQNTLHWWLLRALAFGIEVHTVCSIEIDMGHDEGQERSASGAGKVKRWPLRGGAGDTRQHSHEPEPSAESLRPWMRDDCIPYSHPDCRVPLLRRALLESDSMVVTVYFASVPTASQQGIFTEVVQAWGTVGHFGGFGSRPIDHCTDPSFDLEGESASFFFDQASADGDASLGMLLRILGGFNEHVLALDAIVLGRETKGH